MKEITIDLKNYKENGSVFKRTASRGIIEKNGKYLFIHSKNGDYKFPGGGVENNEELKDTLLREVKEETGYYVIPESICEYLLVHERRKGAKDDLLIMDSYYFICKVKDTKGEQNLDDYEKEEDYQVCWKDLNDVLQENRSLKDYENMPWVMRETEIIKELIFDISK